MGKYLIKRLLLGALAVFALATITFFLICAISDSPFAGGSSKLSSDIQTALAEEYKLDQPVYVQYITYLWNAIRGNFGTSLSHNGRAVIDIVKMDIANSAKLGAVAFCFSVSIGILLGIAAAFTKKRWVNNVVVFIATIGASVPNFLLALMMMLLFGVMLHWLPIVGLTSWKHYIMPGFALALLPISMITRLTRTGLVEVMKQDYMVLAKSKGTGQWKAILRHALKNALTPVVTYTGPLLASLLTGSFVIETLFSIQGIGAEFVTSVLNRDYTMIMALIILYGTVIIICNIAADLIAAALDPRIRLQ